MIHFSSPQFSAEKGSKQLMKRTSKSARKIARNGDVFEVEEGTVAQTQNILVTNVTIHVVNPDEEKGILMRYERVCVWRECATDFSFFSVFFSSEERVAIQ